MLASTSKQEPALTESAATPNFESVGPGLKVSVPRFLPIESQS
jgi:hypothetical protein